MISCKIVLS